jgi:hypothetical protein
MGATVAVDSPGWVVLRFGGGVVALHSAEASRTELWVEAEDPEVTARATGGEVALKPTDDAGQLWRATLPGGLVVGFSTWQAVEDDRAGALPELAVQPLLFTPDVAAAAAMLAAIGARPRISSDSGDWADFVLDDGLMAVHVGPEVGVGLSFEFDGDIERLAGRLGSHGIPARVIDEPYGRSLRVDHPDGEDEIWVNERQTDLYGYRAEAVRG